MQAAFLIGALMLAAGVCPLVGWLQWRRFGAGCCLHAGTRSVDEPTRLGVAGERGEDRA